MYLDHNKHIKTKKGILITQLFIYGSFTDLIFHIDFNNICDTLLLVVSNGLVIVINSLLFRYSHYSDFRPFTPKRSESKLK